MKDIEITKLLFYNKVGVPNLDFWIMLNLPLLSVSNFRPCLLNFQIQENRQKNTDKTKLYYVNWCFRKNGQLERIIKVILASSIIGSKLKTWLIYIHTDKILMFVAT